VINGVAVVDTNELEIDSAVNVTDDVVVVDVIADDDISMVAENVKCVINRNHD